MIYHGEEVSISTGEGIEISEGFRGEGEGGDDGSEYEVSGVGRGGFGFKG